MSIPPFLHTANDHPPLPLGVSCLSLETHQDFRGEFTEVFRREWIACPEPVQWNLVRSKADVLRGVHVHMKHYDYLIIASGKARVGLVDLRKDSPTQRLACALELSGDRLQAICIPPGVAHGFYFYELSTHFYAVSEYWDLEDELGCRFNDPDLGLTWPTTTPILSDRDKELPELSTLLRESKHLLDP